MQVRDKRIKRRQTLRLLGGVVAVAPLAAFWGCDETAAMGGDDAGAGDAGDGDAGAMSGSGGSGGQGGTSAGKGGTSAGGAGAGAAAGGNGGASAGAGGAANSGSADAWATGGTAAMTALSSYPDPFEGDTPDACELTCQLTLGPCHDDQAPEREDISEEQPGLPMRFGLRILDADCQPVTDADVDIWHCDTVGVYSSETSDAPDFCTGDHPEALAARYFRGHRMTDERGVAWFNSCFPGWYASRAIHIHFTVRRSSREGDEYLTSQLAFATDLIEDVCANHPDYSGHGQPDTANTSDTVFSSDSVDDYVLDTQRMSDGALLAYKTIIIRSSLSETVCGSSNAGPGGPGGMMGMGGPPPQG
jgi:protocatechuate 3,4-dioxygenase beta subunit